MKIYLLLIVALGIVLPEFSSAEEIVVKSPREYEVDEEDNAEDEWNLEEEIFGPQVQRLEGINILDEDLNVVLSDPSERVLRKLGDTRESVNALTLEKVKALYREQIEKQEMERSQRNMGYSNKDFKKMFAEENQVNEKENVEEDENLLKKVMDFIW